LAFKINYKPSVAKDLKGIPKKEISEMLDKAESKLSADPHAFPKLKGEFKTLRKFRIGKYRIIYTINEQEVTILKIGHRKNIYR